MNSTPMSAEAQRPAEQLSAAAQRSAEQLSAEAQRSVEQFLLAEAELMDNHQYDDWLALWDEDLVYWVPCNSDDQDPKNSVSLIYDRRGQLEDRLARLKGKFAFAQQPRSRLMRVVSNFVVREANADTIVMTSAFALGEIRAGHETHYFGRTRHVLRPDPSGFKIREKKVMLLANDSPLNSVTFLL